MGYVYFCNNPKGKCRVGDCAVRAVSAATGWREWGDAYIDLAQTGYDIGDIMNANEAIASVLYRRGYRRYAIPNDRPDDYTIGDFAADNSRGSFVVCTGNHVAYIESGDVFDAWNCMGEIPQYYFRKER